MRYEIVISGPMPDFSPSLLVDAPQHMEDALPDLVRRMRAMGYQVQSYAYEILDDLTRSDTAVSWGENGWNAAEPPEAKLSALIHEPQGDDDE